MTRYQEGPMRADEVERFFEAHLPLPQDEVLLGIECGGERMPSDGLWRLEFLEVDES